MATIVEKHFDNIADQYDRFKKKNWYYYQNLKSLYKELIPPDKNVLEVGCGTGDLISELRAKKAVGIDISPEMIKIARKKHPCISFEVRVVEEFYSDTDFDYIFLADVIEHLEDISSAMSGLGRISSSGTVIIFTFANPVWEPVLLLLEKMGLKMPEGPHYRIPYYRSKKIIASSGFKVEERGWRLIFPAYIPIFSHLVNSYFYLVPGLRRLGMLEFLILKKK